MRTNPGRHVPLHKKMSGLLALAGAVALSAWTWPMASSGNARVQKEAEARYRPIENISYHFGSKFMSGYFSEEDSQCLVTLMVIEWRDPDEPVMQPVSAVRVRLILSPGQIAGLDSEEGRSLNVTCAEHAASLLVHVGDRNELVSLQRAMHPKTIAKSQ
jgi:hypothetical protein